MTGREEEPAIKVWVTAPDDRVRDSHRLADGQARFRDEPFQVGEVALMEPRDPDGPPEETFNCRCTRADYLLSKLPAQYLPQIEGRLTEEQRQFLPNNDAARRRRALERGPGKLPSSAGELGLRIPVPEEKPTPPARATTPSNPPPAGAKPVSVIDKGGDVIIVYDDGTDELRRSGTRTWRNNNPGAIVDSSFTMSHGAIGAAGGLAVFPDVGTGERALRTLLNGGVFRALSLDEAIAHYSPKEAGNPTEAYQKFVRNRLGMKGTEILASFTAEEMNNLVNAIIQFEKWSVGTVSYYNDGNP